MEMLDGSFCKHWCWSVWITGHHFLPNIAEKSSGNIIAPTPIQIMGCHSENRVWPTNMMACYRSRYPAQGVGGRLVKLALHLAHLFDTISLVNLCGLGPVHYFVPGLLTCQKQVVDPPTETNSGPFESSRMRNARPHPATLQHIV
jgi:hypothetical protein